MNLEEINIQTDNLMEAMDKLPVKEHRKAIDHMLSGMSSIAYNYIREHFEDEIRHDEDVRRTDQLAARVEI